MCHNKKYLLIMILLMFMVTKMISKIIIHFVVLLNWLNCENIKQLSTKLKKLQIIKDNNVFKMGESAFYKNNDKKYEWFQTPSF